jgi:hypothetical protein
MNKTININPDLFTYNSRGTRKKANVQKEIKLKAPKEHNSTSKKNALLKFIRRHQENNAKKELFDAKKDNNVDSVSPSDFEESLEYLMNMTEEQEKGKAIKTNPNYTLKNQKGGTADHENVSMVFPGSEQSLKPIKLPVYHSNINSPILQLSTPKYGCLKNGTLPTFRQFHRGQQTQKNLSSIRTDILGGSNQRHEDPANALGKTDSNNSIKLKKKYASLRYPSQKRILRRTFHVGKSNKHRKVSVLVSNRTIRNQISNKNQLLKQTPLIEVKRYLVKRGLIKIGSNAPPDVLRKMYESASLMCGDVTNHNSEILMFNYLNLNNKTW